MHRNDGIQVLSPRRADDAGQASESPLTHVKSVTGCVRISKAANPLAVRAGIHRRHDRAFKRDEIGSKPSCA